MSIEKEAVSNTAMQELVFEVKELIKGSVSYKNRTYNLILKLANSLLEKEKQQIVVAFTAGQIDIAGVFLNEYKVRGLQGELNGLAIPENDKEDGEEYFNNTFKQ